MFRPCTVIAVGELRRLPLVRLTQLVIPHQRTALFAEVVGRLISQL